MRVTAAHVAAVDDVAQAPSPLPETLGGDAALLRALDASAALLVITAAAALGAARSALLAVLVIAVVSSTCGRYVASFAATPRDEWYAALVPAIMAAAALALVVPLFEASWIAAYAALAAWTMLAGLFGSRLTARRRRAAVERRGTCSRLDPAARARACDPWRTSAIRAIDVVLASAGLLAFAPVFAFVALAIVAESGSPALFRQSRLGLRNRPFDMLKFRTMLPNAGSAWASPGDDRVTGVGAKLRRTSLDEAPQLWNVIRGDMSLVGPRPEMIAYADAFAAACSAYNERHVVLPGISGWAQLHFDRNYAPERALEVLQYDLFWIRHRSVALYLYCVVKTACEVLGHRAV